MIEQPCVVKINRDGSFWFRDNRYWSDETMMMGGAHILLLDEQEKGDCHIIFATMTGSIHRAELIEVRRFCGYDAAFAARIAQCRRRIKEAPETEAAMAVEGTGFIDPGAARAAVRRVKLRRALRELEALIPALLDGLDQAGDPLGNAVPPTVKRGIKLRDGDFKGRIGGERIDRVESEDVREQELLQGMNLVLQLLNALLDGLGHGLFSSIKSNDSDVTPDQPGGASSK